MTSKSAIKELQKEVEHWRNLALGIETDQVSEETSAEPDVQRETSLLADTDYLDRANNIHLNFYESFPHLVTKGIVREDLGPFAVSYMLFADPYVSIFLRFVFQTPYRKAISSYLEGMPERCSDLDASSIFKILRLDPKVFQKLNPLKRQKVNSFIEKILEDSKANSGDSNNEVFLATLDSMSTPRFIEDTCINGQYSPVLLAFLARIQNLLPSMPTIRILLNNYYSKLYPLFPCIDIDIFEECINSTLSVDVQNPEKILVNPGSTGIKKKLVNVAILYLLLQMSISHMKLQLLDVRSLEMDAENQLEGKRKWVEKLCPLGKKLTYAAAELVSILNIYQSRTEEITSWHLLLWSIHANDPDLSNVFNDNTTEGIFGMIGPLVSDLGLSRDPSKYAMPTGNMSIDHRYCNYRRRLWLCYCLILRFEVSAKGKCSQIPMADLTSIPGIMDNHNGWQLYSSLYKADMITENEADREIVGVLFRHMQLMVHLLPFDKLHGSSQSSLSLSEIESIYEDIGNNVIKDFSHSQTPSTKWVLNPTINCTYNLRDVEQVFERAGQFIARTTRLTVCDLLTRYFNSETCSDSFSLQQSLLFCQRALSESVEGIKYLIQYFAMDYDDSIRLRGKFFTNRISQIFLSQCTLQLTLVILRVDHMLGLTKRRQNQLSFLYDDQRISPKITEINFDRQQYVRLRMRLFHLLEELCAAASEELRYNYISGFRFALLADCGLHFLKQNGKRFLMRDILMSNVEGPDETPGFMESNFHLLSLEEKEHMLLSANEFVHFDKSALQLLIDTISKRDKNSSDMARKGPAPEQLFSYSATSSNVLINQFSFDVSGLSADFGFVFDNSNIP